MKLAPSAKMIYLLTRENVVDVSFFFIGELCTACIELCLVNSVYITLYLLLCGFSIISIPFTICNMFFFFPHILVCFTFCTPYFTPMQKFFVQTFSTKDIDHILLINQINPITILSFCFVSEPF